MRLGIGLRFGIKAEKHGLDAIGMKELVILDLNTGEELEERVGMLWGGKDLLVNGGEPLLTEEYFKGDPDDASYMILVVRCDNAINLD